MTVMRLLLLWALLLLPAAGLENGPSSPQKPAPGVEEPCSPLITSDLPGKGSKKTRVKRGAPCQRPTAAPATAEETPERGEPPEAKAGNPSLGSLEDALSPQEAVLREERLEKLFHGSAWSGEETSAPVLAGASVGAPPIEPAKAEAGSARHRRGPDSPPPAPDSAKKLVTTRGRIYRLIRAFDGFEDKCIRGVITTAPLKAFFLRLIGTERTVLYRGVGKREARNLAANGWRYDTSDRRNLYKFTTPDKNIALAYAGKHQGCVIEIQTDAAVPYYKLTRFWNRLGFSKTAREHLVLVDGNEGIRLVGGTGCGSVL